jgi:hypothetical protein
MAIEEKRMFTLGLGLGESPRADLLATLDLSPDDPDAATATQATQESPTTATAGTNATAATTESTTTHTNMRSARLAALQTAERRNAQDRRGNVTEQARQQRLADDIQMEFEKMLDDAATHEAEAEIQRVRDKMQEPLARLHAHMTRVAGRCTSTEAECASQAGAAATNGPGAPPHASSFLLGDAVHTLDADETRKLVTLVNELAAACYDPAKIKRNPNAKPMPTAATSRA